MDTKDDRYNLENIPDKLWDEIPADIKKEMDKNIDANRKGSAKHESNDTFKNDVA